MKKLLLLLAVILAAATGARADDVSIPTDADHPFTLTLGTFEGNGMRVNTQSGLLENMRNGAKATYTLLNREDAEVYQLSFVAGSSRDDAQLRFTVTGEAGDTVLAQSVALTKTSSKATLSYTLKTDTMKQGRYTLVIDFISSANNYVGFMKDIAFKKPRTLQPGDEVELVNPEFNDGINGWTRERLNNPLLRTFAGNSYYYASLSGSVTNGLQQTVTGLPDGIYVLQACAYDEGDPVEGTADLTTVFLNDRSVRMKFATEDAVGYRNIYRYYDGQSVNNNYRHSADGRWVPGKVEWNRGMAMAEQLYTNSVVATITGGQATFGWRCTTTSSRSTVIVFDHFRLIYLTDDLSQQYDEAALHTQYLRKRLASLEQDIRTEMTAKRSHAPQAIAEASALINADIAYTTDAQLIDAILHAEHLIQRLQLPFYEMNGEGLAGITATDAIALKLKGTLTAADLATLKTLTNLTELDLSDATLTELPESQFQKHQQLTWVTLPKGLQVIDSYAFDGCPKLMAMTLPATLKGIGPYAFRKCYQFHYADIPEGATVNYATYTEAGLRTITLPSTLAEVPQYLCYNCPDLTDIRFNNQKQVYSYAFENCTALTSLNLPEGLHTLGFDSFRGCTGLTRVTLPSSIEFVFHSFNNCKNLKEVTCLAIAAPYNNSSSLHGDMTSRGCTLYVPSQSVESYQADDKWNEFNIVDIDMMPATLSIASSVTLDINDPLPADYKPDLTLSAFYSYYYSNLSAVLSRGTLTVNGSEMLSTRRLTMTYNPYALRSLGNGNRWGAPYNSIVNNGRLRADDITVNLRLFDACWEFISFPFDVRVGDIRKRIADVTLGDYTTDYVPLAIYSYDGGKRGQGLLDEAWVEMTADSILHAGQGYIWQTSVMGRYQPYGSQEDAHFNIFEIDALQNANKPKFFTSDNVAVTLRKHYSEFAQNRSWNLIGNPYPCYYDISAMETTAPITVWSYSGSQRSQYLALSPLDDEYILSPGQAFFIQCPLDDDRLIFHREGRQHDNIIHYDASRRMTRTVDQSRQVFNLLLSVNSEAPEVPLDRARFVINEAASIDYEPGRDASKFTSFDDASAQLYTIRKGVRYAIDERPLGDGTVCLGLFLPTAGTYTLSLGTAQQLGVGSVTLLDLATGTETDLTEGSYTFTTEAGTTDNRFLLRLGTTATGVESVAVSQQQSEALFDLQGRRISQPHPGLYIRNNKKVIIRSATSGDACQSKK